MNLATLGFLVVAVAPAVPPDDVGVLNKAVDAFYKRDFKSNEVKRASAWEAFCQWCNKREYRAKITVAGVRETPILEQEKLGGGWILLRPTPLPIPTFLTVDCSIDGVGSDQEFQVNVYNVARKEAANWNKGDKLKLWVRPNMTRAQLAPAGTEPTGLWLIVTKVAK